MGRRTPDTRLRRDVRAAMTAAEDDRGHHAVEANARAVAGVLAREWPPGHRVSIATVRGLGATLKRVDSEGLRVDFLWEGYGAVSQGSSDGLDVHAKQLFLKHLERVLRSLEKQNGAALEAGRAAVSPREPRRAKPRLEPGGDPGTELREF